MSDITDSPGFYWRDATKWERLEDEQASLIREAIRTDESSKIVTLKGETHLVNLQQRSLVGAALNAVSAAFGRLWKYQNLPDSEENRPSLEVGHRKTTGLWALYATRKGPCVQSLYDLVECFRDPAILERLVKRGPFGGRFELLNVRANPYLDQHSGMYRRFVDVLARHEKDLRGISHPSGIDEIEVSPLPIKHVFHGTLTRNLESILRDGMNPSLRTKQYDWFAEVPACSFYYCGNKAKGMLWSSPPKLPPEGPKASQKLLVFIVLLLPPGLAKREGIVVMMDRVEYELPIFEVTIGLT